MWVVPYTWLFLAVTIPLHHTYKAFYYHMGPFHPNEAQRSGGCLRRLCSLFPTAFNKKP